MSGRGAPVGSWCGNRACAGDGSEAWSLGWEWFDSPGPAVDWIVRAGALMGQQLSPQADRRVRTLVSDAGRAWARERLDACELCLFPVWDEGIRYDLWIQPVRVPPPPGSSVVPAPPVAAC